MMSNAHGRKHTHVNNGSLKPCYIDDPEGRTKYGYIINRWNNTNSANPIRVKSWCGPARLRQDLPESRKEVCNRWKMMALAVFYRFTVNKMILKYQSRRKLELTNHDETSESGKEL